MCNSRVEHLLKAAAYGSCGCDLQKHSPTEEEGLGPGNSQSQTQQGQATNLFPPVGLGGQSKQDEDGPTNPSFPPDLTGPQITARRYEEFYSAPAATPAPTGNPSALSGHEEDSLQPRPKTSAGLAAEAQRRALKPAEDDSEEAKKALKALVNSVAAVTIKSYEDRLNLAEEFSGVLDQVFNSDIGRKNPPSKIPASPGLSGSSGVYHPATKSFGYPSDAWARGKREDVIRKPLGGFVTQVDSYHPHEHSRDAVSCSLCGNLTK